MRLLENQLLEPNLSRFPTSDWIKNDPMIRRWAREDAAAKSSDTPKIASSIQAKLTVSIPGDKYEQEADTIILIQSPLSDRATSRELDYTSYE